MTEWQDGRLHSSVLVSPARARTRSAMSFSMLRARTSCRQFWPLTPPCTAASPRSRRSVALIVGAAHGLDTSTYTVPYVSTWAASVPDKTPVEVVESTAERVRSTALGILERLDTPNVGEYPPGLDREALSQQAGTAAVTTGVRRDRTAMGL